MIYNELAKLSTNAFDKKQFLDALSQQNVSDDLLRAKNQYVAYECAKYEYEKALQAIEEFKKK